MNSSKLPTVALFLLISLALLGLLSWRFLSQNRSRKIVSLDSSAIVETSTDNFGGNNQPAPTLPIPLEIEGLQSPFITDPCYFWQKDSCLPSLVQQSHSFSFSYKNNPDEFLTSNQQFLVMGQIIGSSDNVRSFFSRSEDIQEYLELVKNIHARSIENRISPSLVYAYYNFILERKASTPNFELPDPSIIANLISIGTFVFDSESVSQKGPPLQEPSGWSLYDKSLLYATWWGFLDNDLVVTTFSQKGGFETSYLSRFPKFDENMTYSIALGDSKITIQEYFQEKKSSNNLALCYQGEALICRLENTESAGVGISRCRVADFLKELCGEILPTL